MAYFSFKNKEKENLLTTICNTSPTNDKENAYLNVYLKKASLYKM